MLRAGFGCGCYSDVRAGMLGTKRVAIRAAIRGAIPDHAISIRRQAARGPRFRGIRHPTVRHANIRHTNQANDAISGGGAATGEAANPV
jgi:hypothetical protein